MKNIKGLIRWSPEARYQVYLKKYAEKSRKLEQSGFEMYARPYTQKQYEAIYRATQRELKNEGKSMSGALSKMINAQAYERTQKQASAAYKAYKELFPQDKIPLWKFRANSPEAQAFYELIGDEYSTLKNKSSPAESRKIISRKYFGSP